MKTRKTLGYANVISTLCLFLLLGGGAAYAATHLAKNSVGSKQIKANAVSAAKIKKNAVTTAKIKNGAVNGAKVAAGSLTGANINAPSTPFGQAVYRFHSSQQETFGSEPVLYSLGSYTQPAGQDDQILAGLTVNFSASCEPEREVEAFLVQDPPANIAELSEEQVIGIGIIKNEKKGAFSSLLNFFNYPIFGGAGSMSQLAPAAPAAHSYAAFLVTGKCKSGSGITVSGGQLDILGTK